MAKMSMKKYEGSKADTRMDRAGAAKAGMSMKQWEGSKADDRADRAAIKKANKKR